MTRLVPIERIEKKIFQIRGKKIMLDKDLAELYEVRTKVLLQSVKRNIRRFPDDFMLHLTREEMSNLRSQFVTSSWGGRRYRPYAFTQEGIAMLSSILNSERAIMVNIQIMRVFVDLRRVTLTYVGLKRKINDMEKKHDSHFAIVFEAIRKLIAPHTERPRRITGFKPDTEERR